jgi:hypothetical protein
MTRTTRLAIQSACGLALISAPFATYAALVSGSPLLIAAAALLALGAAILAVAADVWPATTTTATTTRTATHDTHQSPQKALAMSTTPSKGPERTG